MIFKMKTKSNVLSFFFLFQFYFLCCAEEQLNNLAYRYKREESVIY